MAGETSHGLHEGGKVVLLSHGGGGAMTRCLIEDVILPELRNPILDLLDDAACVSVPGTELAVTTDSYVVDPVFFPGGDIGKLAVCGTVNDLAVQGAEPLFMSLALIIEEGFPIEDLGRIAKSAGETARSVGVSIVTGDTKVVERSGRRSTAPTVFLNTTGIGLRLAGVDVSVGNARDGDVVILTGTIGDHGIAVMNVREGLNLRSGLVSDVRPLWDLLGPVLRAFPGVHCARDPTRGGLAAALCDIAASSGCGIRILERSLPVKQEVRGSCAILGLDPLNVANEGKAVMVCAGRDAEGIVGMLRSHPSGRDACVIGSVSSGPRGLVVLETAAGGERIVDVPAGEDLPRIC